jgi:hypothetical protein
MLKFLKKTVAPGRLRSAALEDPTYLPSLNELRQVLDRARRRDQREAKTRVALDQLLSTVRSGAATALGSLESNAACEAPMIWKAGLGERNQHKTEPGRSRRQGAHEFSFHRLHAHLLADPGHE